MIREDIISSLRKLVERISFLPRQVSFFWVIVFVPVLAQTNALSKKGEEAISTVSNRSFKIRITGLSDYKGISVLVKNSDTIFAVNEKGILYSLDRPEELSLELTNGVYVLEFLGQREPLTYTLKITEDTVETPKGEVIIALNDPSIVGASPKPGDTEKDIKVLPEFKVQSRKNERGGSSEGLSADQSRLIAGTGGDILKGIASLPGVIEAGQMLSTDLYVRGGDRLDLLFLYDNIRIGDPFHIGGIYSIFSPLSLERVNFYPSGFPTRFGYSQGAVVDIRSKKDFDRKFDLDLDINGITAAGYMNIPIPLPSGGDIQLSFGGRRTYVELYLAILKSIDSDSEALQQLRDFDLIPFFWDYTTKFDWNIGRGHKVWFSALGAQDKLSLNTEKFRADNDRGEREERPFNLDSDEIWHSQGLGYLYTPGGRTEFDVTFYHYQIEDKFTLQQTRRGNIIREYYSIVFNGKKPLGKYFDIYFGVEYLYEGFPFKQLEFSQADLERISNPNTSSADQFDIVDASISNSIFRKGVARRHAFTPYTSTFFRWKWLDIGFGLRLGYNNLNRQFDVDPRSFFKFIVNDDLNFYVNIGKYSQYPYIETVGEGLGTPDLDTQYSAHYTLGMEWIIKHFKFKVEGYWKDLHDQVLLNPTYDDAYPVSRGNTRYLNTGRGRAYGIELLIRLWETKKVFGWVGYALSRAERYIYAEKITALDILRDPRNNGSDYQQVRQIRRPFEQDVTHNLRLVVSWKAKKWFRVGAKFELATGRPYTPLKLVRNPLGVELELEEDYSRLLGERFPLSYKIDLRIDFFFRIKNVECSFYLDFLGIQGLWGQQTVTAYQYDVTSSKRRNSDYNPFLVPGPIPDKYRNPMMTTFPFLPLLGFNLRY